MNDILIGINCKLPLILRDIISYLVDDKPEILSANSSKFKILKNINIRGFSVVELLIAIAVIAILAAVAVPQIQKTYRIYKFNEYAYSMESVIKWARLTAMQKSINVGVCRQGNNRLEIKNMGSDRSNICNGEVLKQFNITDNFVSLHGSGSGFDPRGFSISVGDICATGNTRFHKALISRFGAIRVEKGSGGCS